VEANRVRLFCFFLASIFASTALAGSSAFTGPILNVKLAPYNAKCDGVTDDHAALQAAITAAAGGSVLIPPGTCVTSTDLTFPNNVVIYGIKGQSKIKGTNAGGYILKAGGVAKSNVHIRDLVLFTTDDESAASAGVFCDAVCTDVTIEDNEFYNFYNYSFRASVANSLRVSVHNNIVHDITRGASCTGINGAHLDHSEISKNRIYNIGSGLNTQWGVYASSAGTGLSVSGNDIVSSQSGGIQIYTSDPSSTFKNTIVSDNTISTSGSCITAWEADGIIISGNVCWRSGTVNLGQSLRNWRFIGNTLDSDTISNAMHLVFDAAGAASTKVRGIIANNSFISRVVGATTTVGIQVYPVSGLMITNNTFDNLAIGIQGVGGASDGVQILGNYFKLSSSSGYGIDWEIPSTNFAIANNTCEGNGGFTFADVEQVNGARIYSNVITGTIDTAMRIGTASHVLAERNIFPRAFTNMGSNTDVIARNNITGVGIPVDQDSLGACTGITAHSGGGITDAVLLVCPFNVIGTSAATTDSTKLSVPFAGSHQVVVNSAANDEVTFAPSGTLIDGGASVTITVGSIKDCWGVDATHWVCK
jgi:Pectate lyase superfamily protein